MAAGPLRVGILGAARIAPMALVKPARRVPEATVLAVAARDPERARRFAARHGIPRVHQSYDALLADPEIDAVYNPLPNALHAPWTIRALAAGKHVLCEKPFAANAAEAEEMARAAERAGRVLVEAFHWRYHPLFARVRAILDAGEIGQVRHLEAHFCIPLPLPNDIRWRKDLAGGALMDTGCYTVSVLRHLAGAERDGRGQRRARERLQPDSAPLLSPAARADARGHAQRARRGSVDLRVPAARVRRRRARRRAGADRAGGRDQEHARDRRDLRRCGAAGVEHARARRTARGGAGRAGRS